MLRLYVDPASISAGWALFKDQDFVKSGSVVVDKKLSVFPRLVQIRRLFSYVPQAQEAHIELLPRACHHYTHWSVGVIGEVLATWNIPVFGDIPVQSWQRFVDWAGKKSKLKRFQVQSEDELAAIGMGLWHTQKRCALLDENKSLE